MKIASYNYKNIIVCLSKSSTPCYIPIYIPTQSYFISTFKPTFPLPTFFRPLLFLKIQIFKYYKMSHVT
jgi:hypothetical protein